MSHYQTAYKIFSTLENGSLTDSVGTIEVQMKESFYVKGKQDGILGKKSDKVGEEAKLNAETLQQITISTISKRIGLAIERINYLKKQDSEQSLELSSRQEYKMLLETDKAYLPRMFRRHYAKFYFIIASVLLIADILLSYQLAPDMFSLPENDDWLKYPISLALALIAFFVKVFYDNYIGFPDGSLRMRYKKISLQLNDGNNGWLNTELILKVIFNLAVLTALIFSFYFLGQSRFVILQKDDADLATADIKWLFILLNILLPVISGILFSISHRTFMNIKSLQEINSELEVFNSSIQSVKNELGLMESEKCELETYLQSWVQTIGFVDQFAIVFNSSYWEGYKEGYLNPQDVSSGDDLITIVQKMRNRLMHRQENNIIGASL